MEFTLSDSKRTPMIVEPPAPVFRTILLLSSALCGGLGLVFWLDSSDSGTLTGFLQVESVCVSVPHDTVVGQIHVRPGEAVEIGQPLIALADDGLEPRHTAKQLEVEKLNAELAQVQAKADVELAWRTKEVDKDLFETQSKLASHLKDRFRWQIAREAWTDYLVGDNALTSVGSTESVFQSLLESRTAMTHETWIQAVLQQETASNAAEVHGAQMEMCEQRLEKLDALKSQLPEKIRRAAGIDVVQARLAIANRELARLEELKQSLTLHAPAYGTVGVFRKRAGDRVSASEPIVRLLDSDRPYLFIQVPSRLLPRFVAGAEIDLEFPDGESRIGRVSESSLCDHLSDDAGRGNGTNAVRIDPAGKLWPIVPVGSAVVLNL